MSDALVLREAWGGAAERGLQAREERNAIIKSVLVEGTDFGVIPGTKQATLLKPGAEKIADSLNLYPDYERMGCVEDWDRPLFHYTYRCILKVRGSDATIATGIGSCNSMEARYRWRNASRVCPVCGQESIIKGKEEYGGGFLCFAKKGGCGAKFGDKDESIIGQKVGQVPNDDIYSLVNTVDKMAQKRAMVAASLNLGFSDHFTQDVEDNPETFGGRTEPSAAPASSKPPVIREGEYLDYVFPRGKHKGQSIRTVPNDYLKWLMGSVEEEINDPEKAQYKEKNKGMLGTIATELKRRIEGGAKAEVEAPFK